MFRRYPYTNFHDINLDWIISRIKDLNSRVFRVENEVDDFLGSVDITKEVNDKLDEMLEDGELSEIVADNLHKPSRASVILEDTHTTGDINGSCYIEEDDVLVCYYNHRDVDSNGDLVAYKLSDLSILFRASITNGGHGNSLTFNKDDRNIYICDGTGSNEYLVFSYDNRSVVGSGTYPSGLTPASLSYYNNQFYACVDNVVKVLDADITSVINEFTLDIPSFTAYRQGVQFINENGLYYVYGTTQTVYLLDFTGALVDVYNIPRIVQGYKRLRELESCFIRKGNLVVLSNTRNINITWLGLAVVEYEIANKVDDTPFIKVLLNDSVSSVAFPTINIKPSDLSLTPAWILGYLKDSADMPTVSQSNPDYSLAYGLEAGTNFPTAPQFRNLKGLVNFNNATFENGVTFSNCDVVLRNMNINGGSTYTTDYTYSLLMLNTKAVLDYVNLNDDTVLYPLMVQLGSDIIVNHSFTSVLGTSGYSIQCNQGVVRHPKNQHHKIYNAYNGYADYTVLNNKALTLNTAIDLDCAPINLNSVKAYEVKVNNAIAYLYPSNSASYLTIANNATSFYLIGLTINANDKTVKMTSCTSFNVSTKESSSVNSLSGVTIRAI